jgi:hypothetical protein
VYADRFGECIECAGLEHAARLVGVRVDVGDRNLARALALDARVMRRDGL